MRFIKYRVMPPNQSLKTKNDELGCISRIVGLKGGGEGG